MRLRILFFCILFFALVNQVVAQSNLMKEIAIEKIDHQRIGLILQKIAVKGKFSFAYNNQAIPADSVISISNFYGSIYSFLSRILGDDYEFKEVPGYIILRHAPDRMILTAMANDEKDQQQLTIKGQVLNVTNMKPVKEVSIYEKNQLISTLTNDQGEFELKLKNSNVSITLTASKENFRDTSLMILEQVDVNQKKRKAYRYYPGAATSTLSKSFVRLFISSKQQIQSINLGGFFAFTPYQLSLTPGLSSHGMYSSQVVNHFSLNLLGGYTGGVQGVELAGLFNIDHWDAGFLQLAGLFNVTGGNLRGVQLSGLYNQAVNKAAGVQLSGLSNSADEVDGVQIAGVLNSAKKVKGLQIGLVNVADSSDYTLGLINFVKNGSRSLSLSYDEADYTHIDFRSGGRVVYGLIGVGYNFNHSGRYAYDFGFGAHLVNRQLFTLDGEYSYDALGDLEENKVHISTFRLLAGLKLNDHLRLFAGPGINTTSYDVNDQFTIHGWQIKRSVSGSNVNDVYLGVTGGLQFTW